MSNPYDDIIHHERPRPEGRAPLSARQRAAQFAPFAALRGFKELLREVERQTQPEPEPGEEQQERVNRRLCWLRDHIKDAPPITVVYYKPDRYKPGGSYETVRAVVRRVDEPRRLLELESRRMIAMERLIDLDCPGFFPE